MKLESFLPVSFFDLVCCCGRRYRQQVIIAHTRLGRLSCSSCCHWRALNDEHQDDDCKDKFGTTLFDQAGKIFVTSSAKSLLQCIDL